MVNDIIQADYEQLENIANRFKARSEETVATIASLQQKMGVLQQSSWEGRAADRFFAEMTGEVLPASRRLVDALQGAHTVTLMVSDVLRRAEEEAAKPFQDEGNYNDSDSSGKKEKEAIPSPDGKKSLSSREMVAKDPNEMFTEAYMEKSIGSHFKGENSAELNHLMEELYHARLNHTPEVDRILDRIADLRGVGRGEFHTQYQKYLQLMENAKATGGNYPGIDLNRHGDFLGTTVSLRYGKVIGDTFGIDPVFGSLLNPTGGLVGPGDWSYQPSPNDAIGYHGIFHDAGGYLLNFHNMGPGYDYLNRSILSSKSALTGHIGGISWWMSHSELKVDIINVPDIPYVPRFIEKGIGELAEGPFISVARITSSAYEGGSDIIDGIGDVFSGNLSEGVKDIGKGVSTVGKGVARSIIDFFD